MTDPATLTRTQIQVSQHFPHSPALVWRTLSDPVLIARWLRMKPDGFAPVPGTRFTMQTTPAGEWDGVIHCEVLEVIENERLVYSWRGGHPSNKGYGSPLSTQVAWTLTGKDGGTQVEMIHSGFVLPTNESAYSNMSKGWIAVVGRIGTLTDDPQASFD